MNKIHKPGQKTMDVTKPKDTKATDSTAEPIVVNRPILARSTPVGMSETPPEPASTESTTSTPTTTHTKHISIKPLTSEADATADSPTEKKDSTDNTTADKDKNASAQPPAETEDQIETESDTDASTDTDDANPEDKSAKPNPETLKAVKEAKREEELEEFIDSKQFFVPIDTVEQKRSILVSIGLTFLLFILAVVLIDLLLDSGFIDLINKLPHTHFFSQV